MPSMLRKSPGCLLGFSCSTVETIALGRFSEDTPNLQWAKNGLDDGAAHMANSSGSGMLSVSAFECLQDRFFEWMASRKVRLATVES